MKKFKNGDIIYNSIKTYPKVKFLVNSGSITYNNDADRSGNAVLFDFLRIPETTQSQNCLLLQEGGDQILTENGDPITVENC